MWSMRDALSAAAITVLIIYYLKYLWRRRYLYIHSMKVPGPLSLPIIGSLCMICKYDGLLKNIIENFKTYPGICRIWHGTDLIYFISDPKYLQIVFNHPQCLNKGRIANEARLVLGEGLITARATTIGVVDNDRRSSYEFGFSVQKLLKIAVAKTLIAPYRWHWILNIPSRLLMKADLKKIYGFSEKLMQKKTMGFENKIKGSNHSNQNVNDVLEKKVFFDYLYKIHKGESGKFTYEELKDEINTLIMAGSDSTSTTACFIMTMLALHQDVQQKVFDEVMDVCGPHRNIDDADLRLLEYTEMVMKETMRLFNAVPLLMREANVDINLDKNLVIPKGSQILIGIHTIHHDPQFWPNPEKFIPERFLPEEVVKRPPCTFIPFSAGARSCIGRQFAIMELKTVIATLIKKYRFFTDYKSIEEIELKNDFTISPKEGYKLRLEYRNA